MVKLLQDNHQEEEVTRTKQKQKLKKHGYQQQMWRLPVQPIFLDSREKVLNSSYLAVVPYKCLPNLMALLFLLEQRKRGPLLDQARDMDPEIKCR